MHLRYTLDKNGKRVYTLKHRTDDGVNTLNAHPGNHIHYPSNYSIIF